MAQNFNIMRWSTSLQISINFSATIFIDSYLDIKYNLLHEFDGL